ncbi:glycosyltransferase family 2 protein [Butyrivibrio sp. AC2005]|uniref:glycosyltransferase family 2 protein n=1 Tax=Butyrivibrio sp. AC2005 TaxID=1280672 RepID=UPI0003FA8E75|nr:glycosyltransferase family 2 protein [Butyrivibrio sp. AC2005]
MNAQSGLECRDIDLYNKKGNIYMCKVSVIMPSLNVFRYIDECILSVLNQTLSDIEILCVDAGSDDGTLEKLKLYEKKDNRIRIIESKKKSYGYQVNIGIAAANGDYIGIVETDDFIEPNMYYELYDAAIKYDLDCVKGDYWYTIGEKDNYIRERKYALREQAQYYGKVIGNDVRDKFRGYMYTWAGIYKKDFLTSKHIMHNETPGASYQDNGFWFQTMMYANRIMYINKAYYNLRRDNPESSFFSKSKLRAIHDEYDFIRKKIVEGEFEDKQILLQYCFYYRFIHQIGRLDKVDNESVSKCYNLLKSDVRLAALSNEIDEGLFNECLKAFFSYVKNNSLPIRYSEFLVDYLNSQE